MQLAMQYKHRVDDKREAEYIALPKKLSVAQLRTQALIDAEKLLREIADVEGHPNMGVRRRAYEVMQHFPTQFELLKMAEDHPMLDARIAQARVTQRDHLPE